MKRILMVIGLISFLIFNVTFTKADDININDPDDKPDKVDINNTNNKPHKDESIRYVTSEDVLLEVMRPKINQIIKDKYDGKKRINPHISDKSS